MRYALAMVVALSGMGCLESHDLEIAEGEAEAAAGESTPKEPITFDGDDEDEDDDEDSDEDDSSEGSNRPSKAMTDDADEADADGTDDDEAEKDGDTDDSQDDGKDDSQDRGDKSGDDAADDASEAVAGESGAAAGPGSAANPAAKPSESAEDSDEVAVSEPAVANSGEGLTYYKDIKPIIDQKCAICHMDGGIGPMPFTSHAEVEPYAALMAVDIEKEVMPPWLAVGPLDKYVGDRRLSPQQKDTLLKWLRGDLAMGDPADEPPPVEPELPRRLQQVDLELPMPVTYAPMVEPDDYRCFVLDWPYDTAKYITALDIVPDNRAMVHHAIVYHLQPEQVAAAREREAADEGPGYSCFGGVANASWLTSYEPGGYATEIPGGLGFEVPPGSAMVLQLHYNTLADDGQDRSHVEFTIKDQVERVGRVSLIMNPLWYIPGQMSIPMGEPDVVHRYTGSGFLNTNQTYEIFWADMHMHVLGTQGRIGIQRASGEFEMLLDIPRWDFAWQETYILRNSVMLNPGDRLSVECHFDNTAENQAVVNGQRLPPRDVSWGDGTTDEMCLGNVLIAPVGTAETAAE